MNGTRTHTQGFTLVEALVAISILVIAIVVPLRVISQSAKAAKFTHEKLAAVFLAQEGIELISRHYQDSLTDLNTAWSSWSDYPNNFSIEPTTGEIIACTLAAPCDLYQTSGGGYTHEVTASSTPFVRSMYVSQLTDSAVEVEASVTWSSDYGDAESHKSIWIYNKYE